MNKIKRRRECIRIHSLAVTEWESPTDPATSWSFFSSLSSLPQPNTALLHPDPQKWPGQTKTKKAYRGYYHFPWPQSDLQLYLKCDTYVPNITCFPIAFSHSLHISSLQTFPVAESHQQPRICFLSTWKTLQWKTDLKISASKTGRQREMTRAVFVQLRPPVTYWCDQIYPRVGIYFIDLGARNTQHIRFWFLIMAEIPLFHLPQIHDEWSHFV